MKLKMLGLPSTKTFLCPFLSALSVKILMFNLEKIASIRYCLTTEVTKSLVTFLVLSRLDYCNAWLAERDDEVSRES